MSGALGVTSGQNLLRLSSQKPRDQPGSFCFPIHSPQLPSAVDFHLLQSSSLCSVPATFLLPWTTLREHLSGLQGHQNDFHPPPGCEIHSTIYKCYLGFPC